MLDLSSFSVLKDNKSLIVLMILSFIAVFIGIVVTKDFLAFNETRIGYHIFDPVISSFRPIKLSPYIFYLTYGSVFIGLLYCMTSPEGVIKTNFAILSLLILRMLCMYFLPLEPPGDIIPLEDWFLANTTYDHKMLVKDLFFSGHTASVVLLYYMIDNKHLARIYLVISVIVGTMLILQHVHYTIDVIVAFLFAPLAKALGDWMANKSMLYTRFLLLKPIRILNSN